MGAESDWPVSDESDSSDSAGFDLLAPDESESFDFAESDSPVSDESDSSDFAESDWPVSDESDSSDSVGFDLPASDESESFDFAESDSPVSDESDSSDFVESDVLDSSEFVWPSDTLDTEPLFTTCTSTVDESDEFDVRDTSFDDQCVDELVDDGLLTG